MDKSREEAAVESARRIADMSGVPVLVFECGGVYMLRTHTPAVTLGLRLVERVDPRPQGRPPP